MGMLEWNQPYFKKIESINSVFYVMVKDFTVTKQTNFRGDVTVKKNWASFSSVFGEDLGIPTGEVTAGIDFVWGFVHCIGIHITHIVCDYPLLTGAKRREWMGMGEWDDY